MPNVIVDASLAVKWVVKEDYSDAALDLLTEWVMAAVVRLTPLWFPCEVSNVLYRKARGGGAPIVDAIDSFHRIVAIVTMTGLDPATIARAIEIADELNQPRTYDTLYVALAEHEDCELWTADERFWNVARARFPWVRWIGQHAAGGAGTG